MHIFSFNGEDLKMMLVGSVNLLAESRAEIDALNVFPVPDGDTGTNMYLTLLAGVKEARRVEGADIGEVAGAAARGCLYGARGNSGVILSQIMRGFADALQGHGIAGVEEIAGAFRMASRAARAAVTEPVEGTILTVCREIAAAFEMLAGRYSDLVGIMVRVYKHARVILEDTPNQLPVLKQAGVVDAGGQGLVTILSGIIRALKDAAARRDIQLFDLAASQQKEFVEARTDDYTGELQYTYCTEFMIRGRMIPTDTLRRELGPYGDCLLVVGDETATRVHIHSNHPGLVLECGLKYGALQEVRVSNMEDQSREFFPGVPENRKDTGIVTVGPGEGIATILKGMGADVVVNGGQTMNPSAEDILQAVNGLPGGKVIILPNNKNIVMAAQQAAGISEKQVAVIPTTSIPQGIAALLTFNPLDEWEDSIRKMNSASRDILTAEVTRAVRDSSMDGIKVGEGQLIGLVDGKLKVCGDSLAQVTGELLEPLLDEDGALVTLYYGGGLAGDKARVLVEMLEGKFPDVDFELYYGGQPLYELIISVE